MMDEYFDHVISSSSRADNEDASTRFPWSCSEPLQVNLPLVGSIRLYDDDKRSPPVSMMSLNKSEGALAAQDRSPVFLGNDLDYVVDKGLISGEAHKIEVQHCNVSSYPSGIKNGRLKVGNMDLQYNLTLPMGGSLNLGYQKQPPTIGDLTSSPSFIGAGNAECDGTEQSDYHCSFKELQNHSALQQFWSVPSYGGASSTCPVMLQDTVQELGLRGGDLDDDVDAIGKRYASMGRIMLFDKLSGPVITEGREYNNCPSTSLAAVCSMEMTANELSSLTQNTSPVPTSCCNGTGKPRVRARRGQATDPHSIAERLRREKIAERMRNLQELVPHSTKLDKASMLDEIIEYVKFLQLQVKVLSMSRLGGAGSVIPLITEGHAECSSSLLLSPTAGLGIDISLSADQISFEQEVVKLMESNVTMAMQYLQSKGLCLMPMSHTVVMSHGIASLGNTASNDRKKSELENIGSGSSSGSSCSLPGIETQNNISCDGSMNEQKGSTKAS